MAVFGTSEAAKSQKSGQSFQKKMMQQAHQWEMQDLKLAGLNPILTATGGTPGSYSAPAPFGPSSAQDIASGVGAVGTAATTGKMAAFAKKEKQQLNAVTATAESSKKIKETEEQTAKNVQEKSFHDAFTAGSNSATANELALQAEMDTIIKRSQLPAASAREALDNTEFGKWVRYINRVSRGVQGKDSTSGN
ncbi:MAG: DNA pilot protein [Microviridae sp.]|nr:MAG: DNA pilot protein [Microviridae sp.]